MATPDPVEEAIRKLKETNGTEREGALEKIFRFWVSEDGIRGKTILTPAKRNMIYIYDLMHEKHPKWGCDKAVKNLSVLFISEDGHSRKGWIDLFRGIMSQLREESVTIEQQTREMNGKR